MKFITSIIAGVCTICAGATTLSDNLPIIPAPMASVATGKSLTLPATPKYYIPSGADSIFTAATATLAKLNASQLANNPEEATIKFLPSPGFAPEAYALSITPQGITVRSSSRAGFLYACQSINQLLTLGKELPTAEIYDAPRFAWRGFMLDEARHFYGKDEVKKILDLMALYKLNRFHWHLTDDQGWRIEIKKYPLLTEKGAWRASEKLGWVGVQDPDTIATPYGGFYTQDDVKEIINYAHNLNIEIMPEIDIPGHTLAAIAAYPEILACKPDSTHAVWLWQGVTDDVINVARPEAVQFSTDVINELIDLFPYEYLHLGGDECPTTQWRTNPQCQARLKEIGAKKYRDLQLDYYAKLQNHIKSLPEEKQRKLVMWNEVLHGNTKLLAEPITIMAWVGADEAALDAATRGLDVILSPQIPYYINRKQHPSPSEPKTQGAGTETVEAVYNYIPMSEVPDSLTSHYKGVQANFWSEFVPTAELLEYLILPRITAVSEAAWSPQSARSFDSYIRRLKPHTKLYDERNLNYAKHIF